MMYAVVLYDGTRETTYHRCASHLSGFRDAVKVGPSMSILMVPGTTEDIK